MYVRTNAPPVYDPYWLDQELQKIEQANQGLDFIQLKEWHSEPPKPRNGGVYYADGTDWNPGNGQGVYIFDGTNFVQLGVPAQMGYGTFIVAVDPDITGLTAGDQNLITFQIEVSDENNVYDIDNNRYQPQVPGLYLFALSIVTPLAGSGGATSVPLISVNGGDLEIFGPRLDATDATEWGTTMVAIVELNGDDDYVEPMIELPTGVTSVLSGTHFEGYLVRPMNP